MIRIPSLLIFLLVFSLPFYSQQLILKGTVIDDLNLPLEGVHIVADSSEGTISDSEGKFQLSLFPGEHKLWFSYLGFNEKIVSVNLSESTKPLRVMLSMHSELLEDIVVTAGRHGQLMNEAPVSMEKISAETIDQMNPASMDEVLDYVPGVNVSDGQVSIRGGSGYSYGAGSRVLVLVDGLPILSPDAGDAKWNFVPTENIRQVEVVKGASSSLYGSSALNGVINIITGFPGKVPKTKISQDAGLYLSPDRNELKWWGDRPRVFNKTSLFRSQQIGQLDVVANLNYYHSDGFRTYNYADWGSAHLKLRYRHPVIKGLVLGVNTSALYQDKMDFFLWQNAEEGAYLQNTTTLSQAIGHRLTIDPYVSFDHSRGGKHALKGRFFNLNNDIEGDDKDNKSSLFFLEYLYNKQWKNGLQLVSGVNINRAFSKATLFGDHESANYAMFAQLEQEVLKRLNITGGIRWEHYQLDDESASTKPLFRLGANYNMFEHTYIRASFGQGYRYPTIAEKYTYTSLGIIQVLPNPGIKAETGWSAEVAARQEFGVSDYTGYIDIAGFITHYDEMMEFTAGYYDSITYEQIFDELLQIGQPFGFQSQNISEAKITGLEISIGGKGRIRNTSLMILTGYTYTNPVDLNTDSVYQMGKSGDSDLLKYRYKHAFSFVSRVTYKSFTLGGSVVYNSNVENIDRFFEYSFVLPGLKEYRIENNKGFAKADFYLAYDWKRNLEFSIHLKNAFNEEFLIRPGLMAAPRNVTLKVVWMI